MKIFELTQLKEAVAPGVVEKIKKALEVYKQAKSGSQDTQRSDQTPTAQGRSQTGADATLQDAVERVRSGEAQLSKDIDAELGKTGADPRNVHIAVVSKIQNAASDLVSKITDRENLSGSDYERLSDEAGLEIQIAAFGYINKKYLNGDDQNFRMNTLDIIQQVMRSQQSRGGQQPAGRVSSSRPQGQQGTVGSGQGTNALDAIAADRARNADF